jgi:RNA-dependent RNA polymerase
MRTVSSPVNPSKLYQESNIIFANSIDIGTQDAEKSMISMQAVKAQGSVRVMLNLDRKELDIQFPLELGNRKRQLRFRLPIALLSHIYKVAGTCRGQTALVIPFNFPPQFFIQRYEGEALTNGNKHTSFSREKTWIDWFTWCRETDVVSDDLRKSLQKLPVMNHKGGAVIDIGKSLLSVVVNHH